MIPIYTGKNKFTFAVSVFFLFFFIPITPNSPFTVDPIITAEQKATKITDHAIDVAPKYFSIILGVPILYCIVAGWAKKIYIKKYGEWI